MKPIANLTVSLRPDKSIGKILIIVYEKPYIERGKGCGWKRDNRDAAADHIERKDVPTARNRKRITRRERYLNDLMGDALTFGGLGKSRFEQYSQVLFRLPMLLAGYWPMGNGADDYLSTPIFLSISMYLGSERIPSKNWVLPQISNEWITNLTCLFNRPKQLVFLNTGFCDFPGINRYRRDNPGAILRPRVLSCMPRCPWRRLLPRLLS